VLFRINKGNTYAECPSTVGTYVCMYIVCGHTYRQVVRVVYSPSLFMFSLELNGRRPSELFTRVRQDKVVSLDGLSYPLFCTSE